MATGRKVKRHDYIGRKMRIGAVHVVLGMPIAEDH
jgi:hypothetical protein